MSRSRDVLPSLVEEVIERVLEESGLDGGVRATVEADLRAHFEDGLAAGHTAETLVARFGDAGVAGRRIASTRPPTGARRFLEGDDSERPPTPGLWEVLRTELPLAFRSLRRTPSFTALVLATLALGVGANTAVFSVLDAVLLQPLPYEAPEELVRVEELWGSPAEVSEYTRAPAVVAMREWDELFSDVAALYTYRETGADLTGGERPERVIATRVSAGFFETLGMGAQLGRTFNEEESFGPGEYRSGTPPAVAVISHGLWSRRFGRDRGIVGQTVELDGVAVEVLGVMPEAFVDPLGSRSDLWVPQDLRLGGSNSWSNYYLSTIARLRPGMSLDAAQRAADLRVERVREAEPESGEWGLLLTPLQSDIVGTTRRSMLWLLAAAVMLVLLSACVNAGNLVFARNLDREREVAIRGALGCGRKRLMTRLLLENALLSAGGALLGLVLGLAGLDVLLKLAPNALPDLARPGLSPGVFLFALTAMAAALVVFGLAPSLRLSKVPPATVLRSGGRTGTETRGLRRVRAGLVVAQVAVALVLLVGAGLLVRSFSELRAVPLGVETANALTFEVHLPTSRYPEGSDRQDFHERFHARLATIPGVESAGATSWLPLNGRYHIWGSITPVGSDAAASTVGGGWGADVRMVHGEYFRTMGIEVRGPEPREIDPTGDPVVWISQSVADRVFPDADPIGEMVNAVNGERQVVGVVQDVAWDARGAKSPTVYVPHAHYADNRNWALIQVVRTQGDLEALGAAIEAELRGIDPDLVVFRPRPFTQFVDIARAQDRFALSLMGMFAVLALVLAGVGTYGVLAGSVAKRTHEIGIRMALGADAAMVRSGIVGSALGMVGVGIALGTFGSWLGSRWLGTLLFNVPSWDPLTYGLAASVLLSLGAAASFLPALRATRVAPSRSLAEE